MIGHLIVLSIKFQLSIFATSVSISSLVENFNFLHYVLKPKAAEFFHFLAQLSQNFLIKIKIGTSLAQCISAVSHLLKLIFKRAVVGLLIQTHAFQRFKSKYPYRNALLKHQTYTTSSRFAACYYPVDFDSQVHCELDYCYLVPIAQ